jgi:hypothetical protein
MSNLKSPKRKAIRLALQLLVLVLIIAGVVVTRTQANPVTYKSKSSTFNQLTK